MTWREECVGMKIRRETWMKSESQSEKKEKRDKRMKEWKRKGREET